MQFVPEEVEILRGILEEAPDYLSDLEERILALERGAGVELLDSLFRSFHSLKGIAGFANLTPIVTSCHRAEDLIKEMKSGRVFPVQEVVDALLGVEDFVQQILGYLGEALTTCSGGTLRVDFAQFQEERVVAKIDHILSQKRETPSKVEMADQEKIAIVDEVFVKEVFRDFLAELEENLTRAEDILLLLEGEPSRGEHVDTAMRAFHSIKGGARLVLGFLPEGPQAELFRSIERVAHRLEDLFQKVRDGQAGLNETVFKETYTGIDLVKNLRQAIVNGVTSFPRGAIEVFLGMKVEKPPSEGKRATLEAFLNIAEQFLDVLKDFPASPSQEEKEQVVRLGEALKSGLVRLGLETHLSLVEEIAEKACEGDVSCLQGLQAEFLNFIATMKAQREVHEERRGQVLCSSAGVSHDAVHTVRVDREKLEKMLNLVGELLILKNATRTFIRKIAEESSVFLSEAKGIASGLERLTAEFQSMVLSLRMVPVAELFARYRRTVRDLAQSLGKNVILAVESGDTELDRTVIEKLADPLTHLVRNAVDHGIETPEEREHCGKPREGKIALRAYYRGAYAFVEVEDDGREWILRRFE
ncbi:MAG: Hpt domain-containing protein [Atribacterota bacterium]